jgi:uncharacterized membrane protein
METNRLEAFSDGVLAIIITIMVLELKVPHGADLAALRPLVPVFLSYVLSFIYVGIYWNNHHHLLKAATRVDGAILWANLHLLFWLSLLPFATGWMGENHFTRLPTAVYGGVLLAAAVAYNVLQRLIVTRGGVDGRVVAALREDYKGKLSPVPYGVGVGVSFLWPWVAWCLYVGVALVWLIPDRRIERAVAGDGTRGS